ncbi:restriction endonuclease [Chromatium okenii]|uniref:EcoAI/FtnUII family type I restriction enzme subunit R n=1 Tax=Chromatium okenii TaxID=61644 RepID=UPI001903C577|nr:DEAD/DEAH box helicase family protein [Chromatium okenii]MBK1640423.1 restriction endonuclease [Chromatium okenii]
MNKKALTEQDICSKFVLPALVGVNKEKWDLFTQIREQYYFTQGRVMVQGKIVQRGDAKKADFLLFYKPNLPLAVIEVKNNKLAIGAGMQQALHYAEILDLPFVYSSNGDGFLEHDRTQTQGIIERELSLEQFPTPAELWHRYCQAKELHPAQQRIIAKDYYEDGSGKVPRYYQRIAINRTIEAVAQGKNRILLVMATGTGKTYTAFQIIWCLWKSGAKKRILFLVDRNILADQTKTNDFKPFGQAMTKITNRTVDQAFEIYLCLYQAVTGTEEAQNIYRQFSAGFFDLIFVDECHRGSAADDAAWRQVLDYFTSATQVGMTATPKETEEVSNIEYFGNPLYTYSLKQGIADGFLAPYKVIRVDFDKDLTGWRPEKGQCDQNGKLIAEREYNATDFDRSLVLEQRTTLVAAKITEWLKATDRFAKTIVFCQNIDHAERMRQALVNANADLAAANHKYVMRITGDNEEGKRQLDHFIDPASTYPVIAVTSQLMSTGVDAQTCRLIVLDKRIQSMTEFKQIIGRGTRINEEYHKLYFTILDFRRATVLFADPAFDGDPVQSDEFDFNKPLIPAEANEDKQAPASVSSMTRYVVGDVAVSIVSERVQYLAVDGSLITESLRDYSRKTVRQAYSSLDAFITVWNSAERKHAIVEALAAQGVFFDELAAQVGRDYDAFDMVCHIAFDQPPLTRRERAQQVRQRDLFNVYGDKARAVLEALLDKYADVGLRSIESLDILKVRPLTQSGTPVEILNLFGGKAGYLAAVRHLQSALYQQAA